MSISSWPGSRVLGALEALMEVRAFAQRNLTNTIMYSLGQKLRTKGTLTITQIDTVRSKLPLYEHVLKGLDIKEIEVQVPGNGNTKYRFMQHNPKTFRVYFPLDSPVIEQVNRLTDVEWRQEQGYHICKATKRNAHVLMNSGFVPDDRVLAFMDKPETFPLYDIEGLLLTPEPYQLEGMSFFLDRDGRAILGDEMGLGKTGQAIGYAWGAGLRLTIAVMPASLKLNWAREITKWTGDTNIFVAEGKKPTEADKTAAKQAKWIVINYDILHGWREFLSKLKPSCLIFDEVQAIKNLKSQRTQAAKYVAKRSERVLALSGTPLENSPIELLPVIQMVDAALFPFPVQYEDKFCNLNQKTIRVKGGETRDVKDTSGATNTKELHKILTDTIFLRRKKAEVLPQLPSKRRAVIPVQMPLAAYKEYKKAEENFMEWLKATDPKRVRKAKKAEALMQFQTLKRLAARGKVGMVADWINTYLEAEPKLVVFAHHKDIIEKLASIYSKSCVVVDGSTPSKRRLELRDRFQEDPKVKLFIGNIKAAGTGLTLTAAKDTLTVELMWTSTAHDQCEDRVHRIGQKNAVTAYYILAEGTVETRIINLIDRKRGLVSQVLDGEDPVDDDMLNELLQQFYEEL